MVWNGSSHMDADPFAASVFFAGGGRGELLEELADLELLPLWTVVRGPVGSGRTVLLEALADRLPDTAHVIVLAAANIEAVAEFQAQVSAALGVEIDDAMDAPEILAEALLALGASESACAILVDDADLLDAEALIWLDQVVRIAERISSSQAAVHLILFGTDGLAATLRTVLGDVRFEGRVRALPLEPLEPAEVRAYLRFRFNAAGLSKAQALSDADLAQVVSGSRGLPALANTLARRRLLEQQRQRSRRRTVMAGTGVLVLLVGTTILWPRSDAPDVRPVQIAAHPTVETAAVATDRETTGPVANGRAEDEAPYPEASDRGQVSDAEPEPTLPLSEIPVEVAADDDGSAAEVAASDNTGTDAATDTGQILAGRPGDRYVLQLLGTSSAENAASWVAEQSESDEFQVLSAEREGRPWYLIVYGDYQDRQAAIEAAYNVAGATGTSPWVRAVEAVRSDLALD